MQIKPLEQYKSPGYPENRILDEHPELLKYVPGRWRGNPAVLAALTGLCLLTASCRGQAKDRKTTPAQNVVAPLFEHGGGRGAMGCVAVNPPVFLSEDEARQVIAEEARRSGIDLSRPKTLKDAEVPVTEMLLPPREGYEGPKEEPGPKTKIATLQLDGSDPKRNISYEFVSEDDYKAWLNPQKPISMVQPYDFIDISNRLRTGLANTGGSGTFAVFYDPCIGWKDAYKQLQTPEGGPVDYKQANEKARELSKQELRRQVQDFVRWLKAQGVI